MLAIRMQRTGRKGHAMFRVIVQDARLTPTSGKVVAQLGSYDPHSKTVTLDKEKASFYLDHGAQPSERAVTLLKKEGVKLPKWVSDPAKKEGSTRNPEKRRSTRPDEPEPPAEEAAPAEEAPKEQAAAEEPAQEESEVAEAPAETEAPAEEEAKVEEPTAEEAPDEAKSDESEEKA